MSSSCRPNDNSNCSEDSRCNTCDIAWFLPVINSGTAQQKGSNVPGNGTKEETDYEQEPSKTNATTGKSIMATSPHTCFVISSGNGLVVAAVVGGEARRRARGRVAGRPLEGAVVYAASLGLGAVGLLPAHPAARPTPLALPSLSSPGGRSTQFGPVA